MTGSEAPRDRIAALIEDSSGVSPVMADLVAGEILAAFPVLAGAVVPVGTDETPEAIVERLIAESDAAAEASKWNAEHSQLTVNARGKIAVKGYREGLVEGRRMGLQEAADIVADVFPYNGNLRPDGSEDPQLSIYVEGLADAHAAIRAVLEPDNQGETK